MISLRRTLPCLCLAALLLMPALALAEPKQPTEEENADATFAKSFLGKTYEDELDIEGWIDLGGGLVTPPVYIREYQREADGTFLVLTSREVSKASAIARRLVRRDRCADRAEAAEGFPILHRLRDGRRGRDVAIYGRGQGQRDQGMVDRHQARLGDHARDRADRLGQAERHPLHQSRVVRLPA